MAAARPPAAPGRRFAWRRRWPGTRPGRPSWWEVPPDGYLEVESRHSPTRPRALRTLAKAAVSAGLSWSADQPLPVQGFVAAQERARLAFHARRELPRVTAVASHVMAADSRLTEAEQLLEQAIKHRLSAAAAARSRAVDGSATGATNGHVTGQRHTGPRLGEPSLRSALGPWSVAAVLAVVAGGQGVMAWVVGRDLGLGPVALGLLCLAAAIGTVAAARLAAGGIDRLAGTPEGSQTPDRRRRLDVAVASGALGCGMTLAVATAHLRAAAAPAAVSLALLGLATAVSYAAIPERPGTTEADRWRSVVARLRRLQQDRRDRRRHRAALAGEAAARAMVRQLREELAVLVPQLFAAEQAALLFWRYQVAIGDATQHAFEQHLAALSTRRARGVWRPIRDWWWGATPPATAPAGTGLTSVGAGQADWGEQVAQVTLAAKRVLVRRRLLDITHGLRLPSMAVGPVAQRDGGPAGRNLAASTSDGSPAPRLPAALEGGQPNER